MRSPRLPRPGGRHVFTGTPDEARARFGVADLADAYTRLADAPDVPRIVDADPSTAPATRPDATRAVPRVGWARQWSAATARTVELIVRNPLTLAILLGSPVMVISMLAALFRPGAIDATQPASGV